MPARFAPILAFTAAVLPIACTARDQGESQRKVTAAPRCGDALCTAGSENSACALDCLPTVAAAAVSGLAEDGRDDDEGVGCGEDVPCLLSPAEDAVVEQNDPTTGCASDPTRGFGIRVQFDWTDVPGAVSYHLYARHEGSLYPIVDDEVSGSSFEFTRCQTFVVDFNRTDWRWHVRARFASGDYGAWSETRTFSFEHCQLASGESCSIPP